MSHETEPVAELPDAVATYFDAHDRHDVDTALAQFAPNGVVEDDGRSYRGADEIRVFLSKAGRQFTYTRTLLDAQRQGDGSWMVRNRLDGDFPGGTVDLAYRFCFDGRLISALTIAP